MRAKGLKAGTAAPFAGNGQICVQVWSHHGPQWDFRQITSHSVLLCRISYYLFCGTQEAESNGLLPKHGRTQQVTDGWLWEWPVSGPDPASCSQRRDVQDGEKEDAGNTTYRQNAVIATFLCSQPVQLHT